MASRRENERFTTIRIPRPLYKWLRAQADRLGVPIYELIERGAVPPSNILSGRVTRRGRGSKIGGKKVSRKGSRR